MNNENFIFHIIRKFDILTTNNEGRKTLIGGIASIFTYVLVIILISGEFYHYTHPSIQRQVHIDSGHRSTIQLNFDISVASTCEDLLIIVGDEGDNYFLENNKITTEKIDFISIAQKHKDYVKMSNWVSKRMVFAQNGKHRGCRLKGNFPINRVNGRMLIIPMQVINRLESIMSPENNSVMNFSHIIHHFSFGIDVPGAKYKSLDGHAQLALDSGEHFNYFINVIPTRFTTKNDRIIDTNQYAITELHGKPLKNGDGGTFREKPGLYFNYNLEPFSMDIFYEKMSIFILIIHLLAIIGGVHIIAGLVNRVTNSIIELIWSRYYRHQIKNGSMAQKEGEIMENHQAQVQKSGRLSEDLKLL